jgi:hypothetical protein
MNTTELNRPSRTPSPPEPTFDRIVEDTVDLVDVVAVAGPPVIFVAGPLVLFAILLAAPVAVLAVVVLMLMAAAALVGLSVAALAAPFLAVRHLRGRRRPHPALHAPAVPVLAHESVSAA